MVEDGTRRLEASTNEAIRDLAQALSGEARLRVLTLLADGPRNMNDIAQALGMPLSTVTVNVRRLEEAGLVECRAAPGSRGTQKIVSRSFDSVVLALPGAGAAPDDRLVDMPIGHFTRAEVSPPCGICTAESWLAPKDDPRAFFYPERQDAELIWLSTGFVEYSFPNLATAGASRLSVSAELCSEAPFFDLSAQSDITLWINGVRIGPWRSPADFGGRRGLLTPSFWGVHKTQFGLLVTWVVDEVGSSVHADGAPDGCPGGAAFPARLGDLGLGQGASIAVRLGVEPDAERPGGMNLFGKGFGDHPQGLRLRIE